MYIRDDIFGYIDDDNLGWYGLLLPIVEEIEMYNKEHEDKKIEIRDIKEKYGTLRIDTTGEPDYIHEMILKAEAESAHICQLCGARGKQVEIKHWISTLCKEHTKAKKKAGYDKDLLNRLYKKYLDIRNYGWKVYHPKEDKS